MQLPQSPAPFPFRQLQSQSSDYELKRRYLALLPSQQIIEICLTFDVHVPTCIKSTIWPADLNAAISKMQPREESRQNTPTTSQPPSNAKKDELPIMDSLLDPPIERNEAETPQESLGSASLSPGLPQQDPEKSQLTPPPTQPQPANHIPSETAPSPHLSSASPAPTTPIRSSPAPQPQPSTGVPPRPPQLGYAHQPYGIAGQSPYPFTSYYPQQWGAYPHIRYPFPSGLPFLAPQLQGFPPAGAPGGAPSGSKNPVHSLPPVPVSDANIDDLPSYEDMIADTLSGLGEESEGLAPKDIWTCMASRYPLQSNFRQSASQALQKAFKKGRFEKSESGRYRLNSGWRGGNATRKGTRRPQLQSGPGTLQGRPPPFTNAPLVRGSPAPPSFTTTSNTNGQPKQMFGYGSFPPSSAAQNGLPTSSEAQLSRPVAEEGSGDIGDAFEAAQHIFQAINFGGLLQMNDDEAETAPTARVHTSSGTPSSQGGSNIRAELQAQLALLVVQLGEILQVQDLVQDSVQETEREIQGDDETELSPTSRNGMPTEETEAIPNMELEDSDSDSDADMDEVFV